MLEKGLVQIYTGDGKGKTTAAFGLALRAAGHGNQVLIYQFLKPASLESGERKSLEHIENITLKTLDVPWDMAASPKDKNACAQMRQAVREAVAMITAWAQDRVYDMIILDEIVYCIKSELASLEDIQKLIKRKEKRVELVMTGRGADKKLIALADLVTDMKEVKHPYQKAVKARKGIEF